MSCIRAPGSAQSPPRPIRSFLPDKGRMSCSFEMGRASKDSPECHPWPNLIVAHARRNPTWPLQADARQVRDFVRAADFAPFKSPWGVPRARLGERVVGVLKAQLTGQCAGVPPGTLQSSDGDGILVACADEWLRLAAIVDTAG